MNPDILTPALNAATAHRTKFTEASSRAAASQAQLVKANADLAAEKTAGENIAKQVAAAYGITDAATIAAMVAKQTS